MFQLKFCLKTFFHYCTSPLKCSILAIILFKYYLLDLSARGTLIYFEYKTRRMQHWYRNMQRLRSLPLKKSR